MSKAARWRRGATQWDAAVTYWRSLPQRPRRALRPARSSSTSRRCRRMSPGAPTPARPRRSAAACRTRPAEPDPVRRAKIERSLGYMDLTPGTPLDRHRHRPRLHRLLHQWAHRGSAASLPRSSPAVASRPASPASSCRARPRCACRPRPKGLDRIFLDAGFEWRDSGCSMCVAMNDDRLKPGERCASTSNRNFEGRQGPGRPHPSDEPGHGRCRGDHRPSRRRADLGARADMEKFTTHRERRGPAARGRHRHRRDLPRALPAASRQGRAAASISSTSGATADGRPTDFVLNTPPFDKAQHPRRGRKFRFWIEPRAGGLGARRFRHTLRHRAELRRDLLRQLLQERRAADRR